MQQKTTCIGIINVIVQPILYTCQRSVSPSILHPTKSTTKQHEKKKRQKKKRHTSRYTVKTNNASVVNNQNHSPGLRAWVLPHAAQNPLCVLSSAVSIVQPFTSNHPRRPLSPEHGSENIHGQPQRVLNRSNVTLRGSPAQFARRRIGGNGGAEALRRGEERGQGVEQRPGQPKGGRPTPRGLCYEVAVSTIGGRSVAFPSVTRRPF